MKSAPGKNPETDLAGTKYSNGVRRCSRGHLRDSNHVTRVLLNIPTTDADWREAIRLGYVRERRRDGRERRRS